MMFFYEAHTTIAKESLKTSFLITMNLCIC